MTTRVIVNGAAGKMGMLACQAIEAHADFELVGALSRQDDLEQLIQDKQADIVVDLTRADSVYSNSLTIIKAGAHPVIGTTGLLGEQIHYLQQLCEQKKLGGIIVPNFSIAAVLMMHFAAKAARFLPEVEIIEAHHQQKYDAPSGTAMKTAELIAEARQGDKNKLQSHELISGARGALYQDIPIHSVRLPGILARQQVIFGNSGETLTIIHDSIDRSAFMPGLILSCQKVMQIDRLYYGLDKFLEI